MPEEHTSQPPESCEVVTTDEHIGLRLDVFLANCFPSHSRTQVRRAISTGGVTVDGRRAKVAYLLRAGQRVRFVPPATLPTGPVPEKIPLVILYEDEALVCIDKPARMVVHPARGHWAGTLTSALAYHFAQLSTVGGPTRPGIVHRLDRDTSGVIVIAKTDAAHRALARQFETRSVEKEYFALTAGVPERDRDMIEQPIGAHPHHREKMAIRGGHATTRSAQTFYEVGERFAGFSALRVLPRTGRTHQIRVHLAHIGCPVLCDRLYSGRSRLTRGDLSGDAADAQLLLDRPALHARRLAFRHPVHGERVECTAPLPADLMATLDALRCYRSAGR